jgi:glycosyltransferase involved in cell wall biosynthesis
MDNNRAKDIASPLVSIITVVFNSEQFIEETILSIINQDYPNIEYIVIDGGSKDRTPEIIKKYEKSIGKWISEKDKGLYDAMNKGLKIAEGDYVMFINSGDKICSSKTIKQIMDKINHKPDVIYGETEIIDADGKSLGMRRHSAPKNLSWKHFSKGMLVCHQSVLVKRSIAGNYNLNYKHSSDFDWLIRVLKKSELIVNAGQTISKFLEGGQTSTNLLPGLKERFRIMRNYYGLVPTIFNHIILTFRLMFYYLLHRRL